MKTSPKTRYALLGLLTLGPASGYDLKRLIEASLRNFWNESYGQIYPVLKELAAAGLATSRPDATQGRRARKVYTLTAAGRAALHAWLAEPVEPQPARLEILLKLFFGRHAGPAVNRRHLEQFRARNLAGMAQMDGIQAELQREYPRHLDLPYWLLTIDYGRRLDRAAVEWCDAALASLPASARQRPAETDRQ